MSLEHYNALRIKNDDQISDRAMTLGMALPTMQKGTLKVCSKRVTSKALIDSLTSHTIASGWACYRDGVELITSTLGRIDLIEAELVCSDGSIVVRYLGDDTYQLTRLITQSDSDGGDCYRDEVIWLRNDLKVQAQGAVYRFWYQYQEEGDLQGRWLAHAQQLLGFTYGKGERVL
ncbi:hypothetical protein [Vibrio sp. DNB22_12_1]